jgi:SAM-dependent methyltransferase
VNLPWLEHAEAKVGFDPRADAVRRGGAVGLARRALLQAMRPYTHHQDELNKVVVDGLREIDERLDDVSTKLRRLPGLGELGFSGNSRLDLARVLEAARTRPGSNHPAISYFDDKGQRVLGFRGAQAAEAEGYRGFEDIFRGDEDQVRAAQEPYLDLFAGCEWVLDVGCGRGEFLDGLRERGVEGRGVDLDPTMVERCRQKGHDVELGDATSYLGRLEDGTVPGIFAAQVIEHLSAEQLTELLALLHRKLAPGGLAVMETVNPHSPAALKAFWTDTTHHHPLFPEVTLALCRLHGFDAGEVVLPQASGDFDEDIYVSRDYAVVARKGTG